MKHCIASMYIVYCVCDAGDKSKKAIPELFDSLALMLIHPVSVELFTLMGSKFTVIVRAITKLEMQGLESNESVETNEVVLSRMNTLARKEFASKLMAVHARNVGYAREIRDVLYESTTSDNEYTRKLSPAEIAMFRYSPTTSVDVERSFSAYKLLFSERRKSFLFENLKQHLIVECNRLLS